LIREPEAAYAGSALEDVLVVDLTTEIWSGLAAAMLGDFGAQVIHVEDLTPGAGALPDRDGQHPRAPWSYLADLVQRNKRGLAVDLREAPGREILRRLLGRADVFLTDVSLARARELGCDYETCAAKRPELIYVRGSGVAPRGPDRELPALDELAAARTGVMPTLPEPGEPPVYTGAGPMYTTGMLALGTLLALHHRAETGEGQQVDCSLLAGNMYGASLDLQAYLAMGGARFLGPESRFDKGNPMSGTLYASSDGRWVVLTMPDTDRWWPAFSAAVGLDAADPRFDTHEKRCGAHRLEMMRVLEECFRQHPGEHWRRIFDEKQLSADIVETYAYPAADPLAYRNRYLLALEHPSLGVLRTVGFPVHLSEGTARLRRLAPARGQHSAEILQELLGYSDDEIDGLHARSVIG
jgi:crotonobetainyl-CoA:carnitine CoA-transferase CaiB-like acyl-CoA transferase